MIMMNTHHVHIRFHTFFSKQNSCICMCITLSPISQPSTCTCPSIHMTLLWCIKVCISKTRVIDGKFQYSLSCSQDPLMDYFAYPTNALCVANPIKPIELSLLTLLSKNYDPLPSTLSISTSLEWAQPQPLPIVHLGERSILDVNCANLFLKKLHVAQCERLPMLLIQSMTLHSVAHISLMVALKSQQWLHLQYFHNILDNWFLLKCVFEIIF